jgi:hypothetical protein
MSLILYRLDNENPYRTLSNRLLVKSSTSSLVIPKLFFPASLMDAPIW